MQMVGIKLSDKGTVHRPRFYFVFLLLFYVR